MCFKGWARGNRALGVEINVRNFQAWSTTLNTFLWFIIFITFPSLPCQSIKL